MQIQFSQIFSLLFFSLLLYPFTGIAEDSFDSDRGNRSPAVLGPAIVDDSVTLEYEYDEKDQANEGSDPHSSLVMSAETQQH